jgi:deoxyguanosine kinase
MERTPTYIAVEGPIGVGKTTLTNMLVDYLEGRGVYEEFEENPFLRKFYDDRRSVAFQTQIFFLFSRFKQQQTLRQGDLFAETLITDYLFAKDRIFAYLNLNDDELTLYDKIYDLLNLKVRKPDLVVHLTAPLDTLLRRIKARGREYERSIEPTYLRELTSAYHRFFHTYSEAPVITVDTAGIDVVGSVEDRLELLEKVVRAVPSWRTRIDGDAPSPRSHTVGTDEEELFY